MIKRVAAQGTYQLDGRLLNALIDSHNAWENLRVELVQSGEEITRLIRSAGGNTLRIVIPPSTGGGALPTGGTAGQALIKQSSTDGDADWEDIASGGGNYRVLTASLSVAGIVPTGTEIDTALATAYTGPTPDLVPADGDMVILLRSSVRVLAYTIRESAITESGEFVRAFTVNAVTYYAVGWQLGLA
jgi:hypothetical protein